MEKRTNILLVFVFLFVLGCASTPKEATEPGGELVVQEQHNMVADKQVTPEPVPEPVSKPKRVETVQILRTNARDTKKCRVQEQEDGAVMVVSNEYDWFLYVGTKSSVECGNFGGKAKITDGQLTIKIESLVPRESSGNIERDLREQAANFIKSELQANYGDGGHLIFEEMKIGRKKRRALCVEAEIDLKGEPGKIAACVTSKINVNDEIVVHRAYWVGKASDYVEKETFKLVKKESSSWFRHSDTNANGKIIKSW